MTTWLIPAQATARFDPGLTVAVILCGTVAGLALARLARIRRPDSTWLGPFLLAVLSGRRRQDRPAPCGT